MLTIFLILIFVYCSYVAYRRGVFYQAILTLGYFASWVIAAISYRLLIPLVSLWVPYPSANPDSQFVFFDQAVGLDLDKSFYAGISFVLVLLIVWIIMRIVLKGFDQIKYLKVDSTISRLGSILLALIVTSFSICLGLFIVAMIPVASIQNMIDHSFLAKAIVGYTPFATSLLTKLFVGII